MTTTQRLTAFIDSFYWKPFRSVVSLQAFRYIACGGINYAITSLFHFIAYNFIFAKQNIDLGLAVISPHIASLALSMVFSFIIGFWLQKNISFKSSPLKGRIQLFRYLISALVFWALSYFIDKIFVEVCHIFPTIAFMMTYLITALLNFFAQRHFIFRGAERE